MMVDLDKLAGRNIYLWGAGRWGRVICRRLEKAGLKVAGFLDARAGEITGPVLDRAVQLPEAVLSGGPQEPGGPIVVITPQFFQKTMLPLAETLGFVRGQNLFTADDFTPHHYIVEVSGHCNLRCLACPRGRPQIRRPGGLMSLENFGRVVEKIKKEDPLAANLQLYQWGEPLMNPELPDMIALARAEDLPVSISSNLNLNVDLRPIIAAQPDWFRVSLSGFGPGYERTHTGGSWEKVLTNLRRLAELKESHNSSMRVEVYYHLYAHNQGPQLEKARNLCAELGFDFQPVWAYLIGLDEVLASVEGRALPPEGQKAAELLAVKLPEALEQARRNQSGPCLVENVTMIDWDLSVPLCLMYFQQAEHRLADNFFQTGLEEIKRGRAAAPFCARCRARAMHRYCDVYYNWPLDHCR